MHLKGSVTIRAPRDKVWEFLTNPHTVSQCAPGLESIEVVTPGKEFRVVTSVSFGTVRVKFTSNVEWLSLDKPHQATMQARGTAPGGNSVQATSEMKLNEGADGTTEMQWTADVALLGRLAGLATRVMGSVTKKLTNEFFDCVRKKIEV